MVLYYASKGQAAEITRYSCVFMAVVSLVASIYYKYKDK